MHECIVCTGVEVVLLVSMLVWLFSTCDARVAYAFYVGIKNRLIALLERKEGLR